MTEELEFESRWCEEFSLLYMIQTSSGAYSVSYPVLGALSLGIKWPGREADHLSPTSAEAKKTWIHAYTPPYIFMA
jgi:hypothetical protein